MKTVIISPHPDDEWIGCGCTLLKHLDDGMNIKVLLITKPPTTEKRIKVSKKLAEQYGYELHILGEHELRIDQEKLSSFLLREVNAEDKVYIPDYDSHIDHRFILETCKRVLKDNKLIQYCVYNNSINPIRRVKNKFLRLLLGRGFSSFKYGKEDYKFTYKLETKNKNILMFGETPRDGDTFRYIRD